MMSRSVEEKIHIWEKDERDVMFRMILWKSFFKLRKYPRFGKIFWKTRYPMNINMVKVMIMQKKPTSIAG